MTSLEGALGRALDGRAAGVALSGAAGCGKSTAARAAVAAWLRGWRTSEQPHHADARAAEWSGLDAGAAAGVEADKALRRLAERVLPLQGSASAPGLLWIDDAELWLGKDAPPELVLALAEILHTLRRRGRAQRPDAQDRGEGLVHGVVLIVVDDLDALHPHLLPLLDARVLAPLPSPDALLSAWQSREFAAELAAELAALSNGWTFADVALVSRMAMDDVRLGGLAPRDALLARARAHTPQLHSGGGSGGGCPWTLVPAHEVRTRWEDVGGLAETKRALQELVLWPRQHRAAYERLGLRGAGGVLLYGPPGTGKTLLASAVAREAGATFMAVSIGDVVRGRVGESEKAVAAVFAAARRAAPCVVFFDEFQALFGDRDSAGEVGRKLVSQLLLEMDRRAEGVMLLASSNVVEAIDPAMLRPGRFDRALLVPLPEHEGRLQILERLRAAMGSWAPDADAEALAAATPGWSGAELDALCAQAALCAAREDATQVRGKHFTSALEALKAFRDDQGAEGP